MAIDFNGTTDRIDIANYFDWAAQAQTWAGWTWWDNLDATSEYLFCDNLAAETFGMILFRFASESTLRHTSNTSGTAQVTCTNTGAVSTGSWLHIAVTWNGLVGNPTTDSIIYVNGAVQGIDGAACVTGTGTCSALTGINSLGGRTSDDTRNFDGRMAEVGRWNRALTASEIAALASGRRPDEVSRTGLKQYFPLNRRVAALTPGVTMTGTPLSRFLPHPIQIERTIIHSAGSMIAAGVD
jgi:hypothetical protein